MRTELKGVWFSLFDKIPFDPIDLLLKGTVEPLSGTVFRNFLSATFSGANFFPVGPPPVENGDSVVFWPVVGLGTWKWAKMAQTPH